MSGSKQRGVLLRNLERLPLQIPSDILESQASLGPLPTLVWINLVALAQHRRPLQIDELAARMGLGKRKVSQALAVLADLGWINDEGLEIKLAIPKRTDNKPETASAGENILAEKQSSFEWLVDYWTSRFRPPSPEETRKLFYWMEKKELSHEVIAVAMEEMFISATNPGFPYLEGILRNWHSIGIRVYGDLLENPHLTKALAPITAHREHSSAERRWKEVFPDEFD